jgi:hypothetical protein
MTLNEMMDQHGEPIGALLNGTRFHDSPATEYPELGTTEMWEIVNMTGDAHPIHLHLVQFQLLNRQKVNVRRYEQAFAEANPVIPTDSYVPVPVEPYLKGRPFPADANERGWKDTFRMNPGQVTRVLVRFAPQDESPAYVFDATAEPGYVWHCHILEHEENDMMRPYHLVAGAPRGATMVVTPDSSPATPIAPATALPARAANLSAVGSSVRFVVETPGQVEIDLCNVAGQQVKSLASGWYEAGEHTVSWQAPGTTGQALGTGVYFVRLRADGVNQIQKLIIVH